MKKNSPNQFDITSKKLGDDFFKIMWPSQNTWTLFSWICLLLYHHCFYYCFRNMLLFHDFSGNASQQRPDVVPGAETSGYDESSTSGLTSVSGLTGSSINNPTSASGPAAKIGSRPKHKRQDQVQQLSYNHSRLESWHLAIWRVFFLNLKNHQTKHHHLKKPNTYHGYLYPIYLLT